jgi:hypothetical protein
VLALNQSVTRLSSTSAGCSPGIAETKNMYLVPNDGPIQSSGPLMK